MYAIECNNVSEKYHIKFLNQKKVAWEEVWALKNISFKVKKGEVFGVIGQNGSGKTTLLKLITGMLMADIGEISVRGRVSTLMELGAGFNLEFTGRENILLNSRIYGFVEETFAQQVEKIIEFAGIGKFIDAPVKYYSQGMFMRLAFAFAIYVDPEILLIDDILAVGDQEAQQRCIKKVFELKESGKTVVLVSHDMNMVSKLCNRVILLEEGRIIKEGLPQEVVSFYLDTSGDRKGLAILKKDRLRLVFNNGRISLSDNDKLLTKGMGGYVSFLIPALNTWISSFNLSWQIKNLLPDQVIVEGRHEDDSVSQVWMLKLEDNQVSWLIDIKEQAIQENHLDLFLIPQYKKWVTSNHEALFPTFLYKSKWHDLNTTNDIGEKIGFMLDEETNSNSFLMLENNDQYGQFRLFNTGYEHESRIIQMYANTQKRISVNIKLFEDADSLKSNVKMIQERGAGNQEEIHLELADTVISSQKVSLQVDIVNKMLKLYFKDNQITKIDGLHSSFLAGGLWHGISSAQWRIERLGDRLVLYLTWEQIGYAQTWSFVLEDNSVFWKVDSKAQKPKELEIVKFGLSLAPEYQAFFCGRQQGVFPGEFTVWQDLPLEKPRSSLFGLRKRLWLPAITLENNQNSYDCLIQNSDSQSACRILQLCVSQKAQIHQELFSFSTKINLLEDETSINKYIQNEQK